MIDPIQFAALAFMGFSIAALADWIVRGLDDMRRRAAERKRAAARKAYYAEAEAIGPIDHTTYTVRVGDVWRDIDDAIAEARAAKPPQAPPRR